MPPRTLQRDLEAMRTIGRFRMLTRQQVKRWFFEKVSEPVVTRFIDRVTERGFVGVERLHGNGFQVLWLTRQGRDFLVERGVADIDLFPAAGPAAPKDFQHTLEIANAALWLAKREPAPDELLPAWTLQRLFRGKLRVIPDLLAIWRPATNGGGGALAVEVDLGTEPVTSKFVPKLRELAAALDALFPDQARTLVLVPSAGRRDSVLQGLDGVSAVAVEVTGIASEP